MLYAFVLWNGSGRGDVLQMVLKTMPESVGLESGVDTKKKTPSKRKRAAIDTGGPIVIQDIGSEQIAQMDTLRSAVSTMQELKKSNLTPERSEVVERILARALVGIEAAVEKTVGTLQPGSTSTTVQRVEVE